MANEAESFDYGDTPSNADQDPMSILNQDFSLEDEYKEAPLVPQGNYQGNVTNVTLDVKSHAILWNITLDGNGGSQSDGETPIDGQVVFYRNWLPKSGDENEMIKSGGMTKRQWKINALADFARVMSINMNTPDVIKETIENGEWIGLRVLCAIGLDEYQGVVRNQVNKMAQVE